MPLHPLVQKMMEAARAAGRPAVSDGSPEEARNLMASRRNVLGPGPDVGKVSDLEVPTRAGSVAARLYRSKKEEHGLLVYFHGGGWVCGALDDFDTLARYLVHHSDCALLLVDYRLAPEFAFPAGLQDAEDAISWAAREMEHLISRRLPLAVGGDSAGANLAIVALHTLRHQVSCAMQILFYPLTDCNHDRPSYQEHGQGLPLTRRDMQWFFRHYAPEAIWTNPRIAALRQPVMEGTPPTWVAIAEYDVLRDEGEEYARRLHEAGVDVHLREVEGLPHDFARMSNLLEPAAGVLRDAGLALKRHCEAHAPKMSAEPPRPEVSGR